MPLALSELAIPLAAVLVLCGMLAPIGPTMLDVMLSLSLGLSVAVLVATATGKRALDFSAFPTVLLGATLLRLSLNVASTRLILLHGDQGEAAAGHVIQSFGRMVVGGDYAVGIVVFAVLAIINFAVITKGASRVAEVAARFTLDSLPGKQMAIDADMNSGAIGEQEAQRRRRELAQEADFYAAMDGIGKFVRGDAVAAILIMVINLGAGFFIGYFERGLDASQAVQTYAILSIGDGLAAQIPALLTSTAAGLIVSRTASEADLSALIGHELFRNHVAMWGAALLIGLLGLLPSLPHAPFLLMAVGLAGTQAVLSRRAAGAVSEAPKPPPPPAQTKRDPWPDILRLELGAGLVPFVREPWKLADRIGKIRETIRDEIGVTIPQVRIMDNLALPQNAYRIVLRGTELARAELRVGMSLGIPGNVGPKPDVKGIETTDPAFGVKAWWVTGVNEQKARLAGYTLIEPLAVLLTHFSESVKIAAAEILTRRDAEELLEKAQKLVPRIVEELSGLGITLGAVYRVLQSLLSQGIAIRDFPAILEAIAAEGSSSKEPAELAERIRPRIGRIICEPLRLPDGTLRVVAVDPALEEPFFQALAAGEALPAHPEVWARVESAVRYAISRAAERYGDAPPIMVSPQIRRAFERVVRRVSPRLKVLGATDIPSVVRAEIAGRVAAQEPVGKVA
jgi:flagellar biosynthesis protein FlhA